MNDRLLDISQVHDFLPWIIFLISFFLGSIPFGLISSRVFKSKDPSSPEAKTSLLLEGNDSWPAGWITIILNVAKGVLGVLLATPIGYGLLTTSLLGDRSPGNYELSPIVMWAAGFFVVLGNCFSPWLHFKGGKGVATALGAFLVLSPVAALIGAIGFILTYLQKKIVSLSSVAGLVIAATAHLVLNTVGVHLWMGAAILFLVLVRHEADIDALLESNSRPLV